MKISDNQKKKIKIVVVVVIIALILWFMVISPILKFKKNEKILENAAKRYYEINTGQLPTGKKIKTVELQTLYDKNFISDDLRSSYTKQVCDIRNSWVKVKKENNDYKYYTYLKCGVFSSKVDHEGPVIRLKGDELITINKGEKFKDSGIDSVSDDTDGKMDVKDVVIDSKKLNVNKIGTYEITYKIKDSFNNETVKIRTVKVTETLNHIVKKDTKGKNVYQGVQYNNYVKVDGILFRIVGINNDGSVKLVSSENLASVNYDGVDSWLNDYFYEKLSDSAKKIIVKQKFCNEEVSDPDNYTKCNKYSKKKYVGLLSVADINNSKGEDSNMLSISNKTFLMNNNKNNAYIYSGQYNQKNKNEISGVMPVLNIKENRVVSSGNGSVDHPYIIKSNSNKLKVGSMISEAKTGEYLEYSGYSWRIIGKADDGSTQIIMNETLKLAGDNYYINYSENKFSKYNQKDKENIGFKIVNETPKYIKNNYLKKSSFNYYYFKKNIDYMNRKNQNTYKSKVSIPSMFDLYSSSLEASFWLRETITGTKKNCSMFYEGNASCDKYDTSTLREVRLTAYLLENIKVKSGAGTPDSPYQITK